MHQMPWCKKSRSDAMSRIYEGSAPFGERINRFLESKPIWVFWLVCIAAAGLLFGAVYAVIYVLMLKWWGAVIGIVASGLLWGSIAYRKSGSRLNPDEPSDASAD
jgi:hypothetical protein